MTSEQLLLQKLALLAWWQYLCHDDFNQEEDFTEDEYWEDLHEQTQEEIQQQVDEEFSENPDLNACI